MAFTYGGLIGPAVVNNGGSGTTQTYSVNTTVPVGALITLFVTKSVTMATVTATDSKGNTWTQRQANTEPVDTQSIVMMECIVTTQLVSGDTVTVTVGGTFSVRLLAAPYFTAAGAITFGSAAQADSTFPHQTKSAGSLTGVTGNLVVAGWVENSTDTWTAGAGYTGLTKVEDTGVISSLFVEYDLDGTAGTFAPGATVTTGSSSAGIGARYVETPPPATAAGQYGWGTYGAGDYGSNFGGTSSTPISGSETHTLTDSSSVAQSQSPAVTDSGTISDASAPSGAISVVDAATLSDASAVAQTLALSVTDSLTLSDASAVLATLAISATDSWALTDASALAQSLAVAVSETHTLTDSSSVLQTVLLSANDSWTLTDVSAVASTLAVIDSGAITDASALALLVTALDSGSFTEAATLANAFALVESGVLSDVSSITASMDVSETIGIAESAVAGPNQVTFRAAVTDTRNGTSFVQFSSLPAGAVAGDYLLAFVAMRAATTASCTPVDPDWTLLISQQRSTADVLYCFGRYVQPSDSGSLRFNSTGGNAIQVGGLVAYSSVDQVAPMASVPQGSLVTPTTTNPASPAQTTFYNNVKEVRAIHTAVSLATVPTYSWATAVERLDTGLNTGGSSPSSALTVADIDAPTAGAQSTRAATTTTATAATMSLALAPEGSGVAINVTESSTLSELAQTLATADVSVSDSFSATEVSALSAALGAVDSSTFSEQITAAIATAVSDGLTQTEASSIANALAAAEAFGFTDSSTKAAIQLFVASDSFTVTDSSVLLQLSAVPTLRLPTKATISGALDADALITAVVHDAALTPIQHEASLSGPDSTVDITAVILDVEIDLKTGDATVVSKIGSVTIDYDGN